MSQIAYEGGKRPRRMQTGAHRDETGRQVHRKWKEKEKEKERRSRKMRRR